MYPYSNSHTCGRWGYRKSGAYVRAFAADNHFYEGFGEDGHLNWQWRPRDKLVVTADLLSSDFDWTYESRGRRSTGWKEHKCRHQWEHRIREAERYG